MLIILLRGGKILKKKCGGRNGSAGHTVFVIYWVYQCWEKWTHQVACKASYWNIPNQKSKEQFGEETIQSCNQGRRQMWIMEGEITYIELTRWSSGWQDIPDHLQGSSSEASQSPRRFLLSLNALLISNNVKPMKMKTDRIIQMKQKINHNKASRYIYWHSFYLISSKAST